MFEEKDQEIMKYVFEPSSVAVIGASSNDEYADMYAALRHSSVKGMSENGISRSDRMEATAHHKESAFRHYDDEDLKKQINLANLVRGTNLTSILTSEEISQLIEITNKVMVGTTGFEYVAP